MPRPSSRPRRRAKTTSKESRTTRRQSRSGTRRAGTAAVGEWAQDLFAIGFAAVYHVHQVIGRANPGRMRLNDPLLALDDSLDSAVLVGDAGLLRDHAFRQELRRGADRHEGSLRPRAEVERDRRSVLHLKSRMADAKRAIKDPSALFALPPKEWPAQIRTAASRLRSAVDAEREAKALGSGRLPDRLYRYRRAISLAAERLDDGIYVRRMRAWGMPEGQPFVEFIRDVLVSPGRKFSTSRVLDDIADGRGGWGRVTELADCARRIRDVYRRLDEALLTVPYDAGARRRVMVAMLIVAEKLVQGD